MKEFDQIKIFLDREDGHYIVSGKYMGEVVPPEHVNKTFNQGKIAVPALLITEGSKAGDLVFGCDYLFMSLSGYEMKTKFSNLGG